MYIRINCALTPISFKEKVLCHAQIVISYKAIYGTLLIVAIKEIFYWDI